MSGFVSTRKNAGAKAFSRRQDNLLKDIRYLSARASEAIRDGDKQATGEALGLFERLMIEAVEHHNARRQVSAHQLLSRDGSGIHSREWRELMQMLLEVEEASSLAPTRRLRNDVLNSVHRIVSRLLRAKHFEAARQVVSALGWMWAAIDAAQGTWDSEDMDYFLMRLREASSISAPRSRDFGEATAAAQVYLYVFATVVRTSIDRGHWRSAAEVVRTLAEASNYTGQNLYRKALAPGSLALGLSLLAWIVMRQRSESSALVENECTAAIVSLFERKSVWEALGLALSDSFQQGVGSLWWEIENRTVRGASSGLLEMDRYLRLAALVVSRRSHTDAPPDSADDRDAELASSLLNLLNDLIETSDARFALESPSDPHPWRHRLQQIVEEQERRREQALAESPLDLSRIDAFRQAIDDALRNGRGITDSISEVECPSGLEPTFGFNRLEPKFWFTDSHVYADPAMLAREFVGGIRRGEDARIVAALFDSAAPEHVLLEELTGIVADWVAECAQPGAAIVLTNSWRAADTMRMAAGGTVSHDIDGPEYLRMADHEVALHRLFDSRDPYVAVFASPNGLAVQIGVQESPVGDPAVRVHANRMVSTVRPPTEHELETWQATSVAQGDELRRQVVVKVVEAFDVKVVDSRNLAVWQITTEE